MNVKSPPTLTRRRFSSPPTIQSKAQAPEEETFEKAQIRPEERSSSKGKWAKVGLLALAAGGALAGCKPNPPVEPAVDPGAYEMVDPSFVYLGPNTHKIDIQREYELDCPYGYRTISECDRVKVDYSDLGIHIGHGIVEDFNGNLFAVPQLQLDNKASTILENPGFVTIEESNYFGKNEYVIQETEPGIFTYSYEDRRPRYIVNLDGPNATVKEYKRIGNEYRNIIELTRESSSKVVLNDYHPTNIQSQGDHLLIQESKYNTTRELVYGPKSYKRMTDNPDYEKKFTVEDGKLIEHRPAGFLFDAYTVTYESTSTSDNSFNVGRQDSPYQIEVTVTGPESGQWIEPGRSKHNFVTVSWEGGRLVNGPS